MIEILAKSDNFASKTRQKHRFWPVTISN